MKKRTRRHTATIRLFSVSVLLISIVLGTASQVSHHKNSGASALTGREKHVIIVQVEKEDTLWSIASEYYTSDCGTMNSYIKEIKESNHLSSDTIYEDSTILVPVWEQQIDASHDIQTEVVASSDPIS